uniref:Uncharacterized protein n=1 Tax=Solanum lycopersicum TaxID=4081 RepID=A0A3Q7GCE0_SOLLC
MGTEGCLEVQWQPNLYGIKLPCLKEVRCSVEISIFLAFRFLGVFGMSRFLGYHLSTSTAARQYSSVSFATPKYILPRWDHIASQFELVA